MSDWYVHKDTRGVIPRTSYLKRLDRVDWLACDEHGNTIINLGPLDIAFVVVPDVAPAGPEWFVHAASGAQVPAASVANFLARGSNASDFVPYEEATVAASAVAYSVLPINRDDFNKDSLVAIAAALGLDSTGTKAELIAAINDFNDEAATAAAIVAL